MNADITVYNKHYNENTRLDEWQHTQIRGVNWYGKQAVSVGENGLMNADQYTVRIPLSSAPAEKAFVTPDVYAGAASETLAGFWTLQSRGIVARGLVDVEDPKDIAGEHFIVTGWSDNRRGSPIIQHWRVDGK